MTTSTRPASTAAAIPPESEAQFQAAVIKLAKVLGYRVYHTYDSRRSEPGFPDLVLVKQRRILFLECKRQGGRATRAQKEWMTALNGCQTETYFVYPTSMTFLARLLQEQP